MPKRALLSVHDKSGLAAFARGLVRLGYELYSTGGTERALQDAAVDVRPVSELTGFSEILDGRVKTLHPGVHGGILARRDVAAHVQALEERGLKTIDLVCCNLYPFAATAARPGVTSDDIIEQIDIGGPAMIRSAAKNHAWVAVVVRPERYGEVLAALQHGDLDLGFRRRLAAEAFAHTAHYDSQIARWLRPGLEDEFPVELTLGGTLTHTLRYGENPHQVGGFYRVGFAPGGLGGARQLQGVELSYNNIQDAAAAYELAREFERPAAAVIKHMNPCGLAEADSLEVAYQLAYECDPVSAYGGVVALNRPLDQATAEKIAQIFVEVVIAPRVEDGALQILARRSRVRVLEADPVKSPGMEVKTVPGGFLAQSPDTAGFTRDACRVVSRRQPTEDEWEQMRFAWLAAKHVKSNAIVLARDFTAVGVGAGQMSRVEAVRLAVVRAGDRARGSVMASDAFFPFPDGVEAGIDAGVTAIIQPGGSMRDPEVIEAADQAGLAMVVTGQRHFLH